MKKPFNHRERTVFPVNHDGMGGKIRVAYPQDPDIGISQGHRVAERDPCHQGAVPHNEVADLQGLIRLKDNGGADFARAEQFIHLAADGGSLFRDDHPGVLELVQCNLIIRRQRMVLVDDKAVLYLEERMNLKPGAPVQLIADRKASFVRVQVSGTFGGIALTDGDLHVGVVSQQKLLQGRGAFGNNAVDAEDKKVPV